jgi:hypothetical protein
VALSRLQFIAYGALAATVVVAAGVVFHVLDRGETAAPVATGAVPRPAVPTDPTPGINEATVPTWTETDRVARLVGEARRAAHDGNFAAANAALAEADKAMPGSADIAQVRREIAEMSTPQAQLAVQLERARSAIAQDDRAGAETALAAAERLSPQTPEIPQLRQRLQDQEQRDAERSRRIAELLSEMRQAIARRDIAAANRALNEAERLDVRDPAIDSARLELAHAQDERTRQR